MDRPAKAVISELLARHVTPLLERHGFTGRGRTYRRVLADRQELLTVEPHRWNTRHGGAFTIHLGVARHRRLTAPARGHDARGGPRVDGSRRWTTGPAMSSSRSTATAKAPRS